jgi:hypothetical protein
LPGIVTVENIRYRHFSRNPHTPLITGDGGVVTVTLYAIQPVIPADVAHLGLNERQARILFLLAERE